MTRNRLGAISMDGDAIDQLVLSRFPYPIAVNYQRLLEEESWEARTRKCIEIFEFGLRAVTLGVLSQYLIRDVHQVSDTELDRKLYSQLPQASVGQWTEFLFLCLRAYRGKRKLFFMPELYDLYWDTSQEPHRPRKGLRAPFDRLVQIRNDLAHRLMPASEEAWEALGREALGHLRTILAQFSFLQHYDLIRMVGRRGDEYEYERYTGQEITTHRERLRGREEELQAGWFYLSRQDRSVLGLHPLLIFWANGGESELTEEGQRDAAVFGRLLKEAVEYVATVVRQTVKERDADLIAQFRQLIYYNIEHIKLARKRTVLSWVGLQQAAVELSAVQMGCVWEKYQRELYLQRDQILRKFQEFLASDKGCFVLTGKSGVGKSNFVLSLADEYAEREDVCLLMYNGARLSVSETMVRTISQDLSRYLTLEGEAAQDLFAELDRQGEMVEKTLIVVFDAINENVDGKVLLRQIDQMVGEVRYPWLKVLITSRPQAWRVLKRGVRLAEERYYREAGSDEYLVELREFTVQIEPFQREELPAVYEKYRRAYGLQTEYEMLKVPIRGALKDPLMLRLVAEIYRDQAIPERIRVSDIYNQYLQALLAAERLYKEDIILLERELMPLMIAEGHYDNKLTASQIHMAKIGDGRPLWELIHSDDQLSSGRRVNDSYVRLVDAEILTEQGPPTDYEITFKYERFYDYYGGKRLLELVDLRSDERETVYRELVMLLRDHPFLWGPTKTALVAELGRRNTELFINLAQIPDDTTKQLLVTALSEYGQDDAGTVQPILETLMALKEQAVERRFRRQEQRQDISLSLFTARKVAIETASNLELGDILVTAACDPSASVRMHAAQYIHRLWNQNDQVGLETLTGLSEQVKNRLGIPRPAVLESMVGASVLITFEHHKDSKVMGSLQQVWRRMLEQLLFIRGSESDLRGRLRRRIRGFAVFLIARVLVRLAQLVPPVSNLSVPELNHFVHLDPGAKQKLRDLLPYLNPSYGSLEDIQGDLITIAGTRDILTMYLVHLLLSVRGMERHDEVIPVLDPMFRESIQLDPPGPMAIGILNVLAHALAKNPSSADEALDLLNRYTWEFYERSASIYETDVQAYQHSDIDGLIVTNYEIRGTYYPDDLKSYLATSKERNQFRLHRLIVGKDTKMSFNHLDLIAAYGYPTLALRVAELLLDAQDEVTQRGLHEFLARLRRSHQDAVDDFIEEFSLQAEDVRQAEATVSAQAIGDVLALTGAPFLAEARSQPRFFREVLALFEGMLACSSVAQVAELFIKRMVNFIYGSPVFDLS
jgi:hypothetical protein